MKRIVPLSVALTFVAGCAGAPICSYDQARTLAGEAKIVAPGRKPAPSDASKSIDEAKEELRKEAGDARRSRVFRHLRQQRLPIETSDLESYIRVVDSAARRFHLDPLMVLAVIHVESRFDPYAVSPAGCVGLMQLQVDTAREIAPRLHIAWTSDDILFDPKLNILLGTCYLRELLDRFRDPDLALAAFHSGPSRIAAQNLRIGPSSLVYATRVRTTLLELQACARV